MSPWVTHERLDDEVIAINLETGAYFAFSGVAADCWTLLVSATPVEQVVSTIADRYSVDAARVGDDVAAFLAQLEECGLTTTDGSTQLAAQSSLLPAKSDAVTYATPSIERYDDLEELLLLDPVHEVDEAGWPVPAAE